MSTNIQTLLPCWEKVLYISTGRVHLTLNCDVVAIVGRMGSNKVTKDVIFKIPAGRKSELLDQKGKSVTLKMFQPLVI